MKIARAIRSLTGGSVPLLEPSVPLTVGSVPLPGSFNCLSVGQGRGAFNCQGSRVSRVSKNIGPQLA